MRYRFIEIMSKMTPAKSSNKAKSMKYRSRDVNNQRRKASYRGLRERDNIVSF